MRHRRTTAPRHAGLPLATGKRVGAVAARRRLILTLGFASSLAGCSSIGPRVIRQERTHLNLAIQQTEDTQLLLNLVRLKYHDSPLFLELTGVTSQSALETCLSNGDPVAEIPPSPSLIWKPGPGVTFSTQPTISYVPLHGERFAQQLLAPMKIETLMLLYRSGWPLEKVLRLCVQRLNHLENGLRASGPGPGTAPDYETFSAAVALLARLNKTRDADLVYESLPDSKQSARIVLQITQHSTHRGAGELRSRLKLLPGRRHYPVTHSLVEHLASGEPDHLEVEVRSLQGVLYFLSQVVEVPAEDINASLVAVTQTSDGAPFDWSKATYGLLRVRTQPSQPRRAATSVRYKGKWFYIDDSDLASKFTFALLVGTIEIGCGGLVLLGWFTRLAVIPLLIIMAVAIASTKIPILLADGFWKMAHETRTDYSMVMGSLFLLLAGGGRWSLDARRTSGAGRQD